MDDGITIASPFNSTDFHDHHLLPNGDYVLLAYSKEHRDLSFIDGAYPGIRDKSGNRLGPDHEVRDSVVQVQHPDGTVAFNWNAWDHMAIEDCISINGGTFNPEYAHVNSLGSVDGDILVGFRHCSAVMRVDLDTGDVVWRAGPSIHGREQWEGGETLQSDRGPAPLDFVNDPRGGFSGNHGGHMTVDGNLLVYDNATHCGAPPGVPQDSKGLTECEERTRGVEYAIDLPNNELVFQSEFRMPGSLLGGFGGHAEPLDNGDWILSWSQRSDGTPMPATAVHVDADTGREKLSMTMQNIVGSATGAPKHSRVIAISPVALAPRTESLRAALPSSEFTSVTHSGSTDSPQVVVAFDRPVVDFGPTSPSLRISGGTVASVRPHVEAGEPANAYLITLAPSGDGDVLLRFVADQACAGGGVCTADGTVVSDAPGELTRIEFFKAHPRVTLSLDATALSEDSRASTLTVTGDVGRSVRHGDDRNHFSGERHRRLGNRLRSHTRFHADHSGPFDDRLGHLRTGACR